MGEGDWEGITEGNIKGEVLLTGSGGEHPTSALAAKTISKQQTANVARLLLEFCMSSHNGSRERETLVLKPLTDF